MKPQIALQVDTKDDHVLVKVTLRNPADADTLLLEPWQLFRQGMLNPSLLEVKQDGQPVLFLGPMSKRRSTKEENLIALAPGGQLEAHQDISSLYRFAEGTHEYSIVYSAFAGVRADPTRLVTLESAAVRFTVTR